MITHAEMRRKVRNRRTPIGNLRTETLGANKLSVSVCMGEVHRWCSMESVGLEMPTSQGIHMRHELGVPTWDTLRYYGSESRNPDRIRNPEHVA
jgi:hypothetical protein